MAASGSDHELLVTINDLISHRARDPLQKPLLAFPKNHDVSQWEEFTGEDLNRFTEGATQSMKQSGLLQVSEESVVAILGQSDLDFSIATFGLMRLGYSPCIISPRLSIEAIAQILKLSRSNTLMFMPQYGKIANQVAKAQNVRLVPMPSRAAYDIPASEITKKAYEPSDPSDGAKVAVYTHSAGSTGIPRIIPFTHGRLLNLAGNAYKMRVFCSMPFFHGVGYMTLIQCIFSRYVCYFFDGNMPQTHDTLVTALTEANPEAVITVPYALKLLAEKEDGVELLRKASMVSCVGSRIPDEIGDLIVEKGVYLVTAFGASEAGFLFTSMGRPRDDKDWAYLRAPPPIAPYIHMKPMGNDIFECVVLDGYIGKVVTNSNDPPNSYHTKDLFEAHPTKPGSWKYVGRIDDRVTLINGEKILPLEMEGRIRQDALVKDSVVFGVDKPVPGLLVFQAINTPDMSEEQYIDAIWPSIEDANSRAEGFAQISREMISVLPPNIDVPLTDKASIKRAQIYKDFASIIEQTYTRMESNCNGVLELTVPELEQWILDTFKEKLGIEIGGPENDFHSEGVDSLRSIQMRSLIIRNLNLNGNAAKCSSLMVLECSNARRLAKYVDAVRSNSEILPHDDEHEVMANMIENFSKLGKEPPLSGGATVLLTGATGTLGAYILHQIASSTTVNKVYCLIRASSAENAHTRLLSSLAARQLHLSNSQMERITSLPADFSTPSLGLPGSLHTPITHIIHCAWPVSFTLPLSAFTPSLATLHNLLTLSRSTSPPAKLLFCSSIGTATASPSSPVPEASIANLSYASSTGYARSKLVAEHVIENAAREYGVRATVLRIGQIVPPLGAGSRLWNPAEAVPLMVRAGVEMGVMPVDPPDMASCAWVPVDVVAAAVAEFAGLDGGEQVSLNRNARGTSGHSNGVQQVEGEKTAPSLVYNVVHPHPFTWHDFLALLKASGLEFHNVSWSDWLKQLANGDQDPEKNPAVKLLGFWQGKGGEENTGGRSEPLVFSTEKATAASASLRDAGTVLEEHWGRSVVAAWKKEWEPVVQ